MSGRRGCPPGARPPSEKDLKTPKIGQFFHQQTFAPIFQQRMGEGAGQDAKSQHDHVDLTGGRGEPCSQHYVKKNADALDERIRMIGTMKIARLLEI